MKLQEKICWKKDDKMVVTRRFERIYKMIESKAYTKVEDIRENKEIFKYWFNYIKTDKIDEYIIFGCGSDESNENYKLFNFWSYNFMNKEIGKIDFKITVWSLMTLVKRNNFFFQKSRHMLLNDIVFNKWKILCTIKIVFFFKFDQMKINVNS